MTSSHLSDGGNNPSARFSSIADAIAYVEAYAARPEAERETLPPHERQQARLPEMRHLLAELGNPQDRLRVAHVTGTSGKGSTATMLDAILRTAGYHTGLYTNPYITQPQERVQLAGAFIADDAFIACTVAVADAIDRLRAQHPEWHPHLKQVWVALALLAFARAGVDYAIVEVGMGGRFDETNVVHPVVAIITTIGFDHMEFLGTSLAEIAWHKAGIIKEGAPVITGVAHPTLAVIQAEATQMGSPVAAIGHDFTVKDITTGPDGTTFTYQDTVGILAALHTPLMGVHQAHNAALAVRAARAIQPDVPESALRTGLATSWLPGRFEIVAHAPTVVLDAAHNVEKMAALVATMRATLIWRVCWVIFGALGAKDIAPMLATLAGLQPRLIATTPHALGRIPALPTRIAETARTQGIAVVAAIPEPDDAVAFAMQHADPHDVIVVTGSLFLVSQLRDHWRQRP